MAGRSIDGVRRTNIVLVGCGGNGKSATGNSILGREAFKSQFCLGGVTRYCQEESTVLQDGQNLNIIDTPGLFDSSSSPEMIEKELLRCIDMAKGGIQAIVMVVSLRGRFTEAQVHAFQILKLLFGSRIVDYMIVVFTGGDQLEEDEALDDRLASACPENLKELLEECGKRIVVFDNKTRDEGKKAAQLHQLLTFVSKTVEKNGGKPYTNELFLQHHYSALVSNQKLKERRDGEVVSKLKEELEITQREMKKLRKQLEIAQSYPCSVL